MSEDYEMMCGIEIHQQLDTKKLFCSCDSHLCDDGEGAYFRRLRPTTSEMGEVDRAALAQFQRHSGYRYQCCRGTTCLVELDEEPPHDVNPDAMEIALTFSEMLGANIIDEIHFMRKIVVDGSNTSGFQRTALIATDGSVDVGDRKISILSATRSSTGSTVWGSRSSRSPLDRTCARPRRSLRSRTGSGPCSGRPGG